MFGKLKYLFLYAFEATERMEQKAVEIAEERKKRMEKFRQEHKEMEEKARHRLQELKDETREKVRDQVNEMIKEIGLATKAELEDLKHLLEDISETVDKLAKKK
jgi:F0F1-type ATP synthase membrane subunit b/b'